ncbi:hypothetical protein NXS98_07370 [Fontisphaera persica]|nr:hypothetical protein [Fontisphaera persica]WCJ60929.1 hypothetical protein NXS98_07370 [Fontisphaera persica]
MGAVEAEIDAANFLQEAVATPDLKGKIGKEGPELEFGRLQFRFHHQLQPEAEFGHVDGPILHIHSIKLLTNDATAAFIRRFFEAEPGVGAGLEVIEHQQHADQKRAAATGGIANREFPEQFAQLGPEVMLSKRLIGALALPDQKQKQHRRAGV